MSPCRLRTLLWIGVVLAATARAADAQPYVWWEGENPDATNFPERSWFSASTFPQTAERLSGGRWLSNSGERTGEEAFARYTVRVPRDGVYAFWTRKFWKHGPFRWRFDDRSWRTCGRDVALADSTPLKTHVVANWVALGEVELTAGEHTFELRLLADKGEALTAAFDCFLLTQAPFAPRGKHKPDAQLTRAEKGWFAWDLGVDPFDHSALLDLRRLNEARAGQDGFLRADGERLLSGGDEPVRLWAVNVSARNAGGDRALVDYLAKKLAKLGVNAVRYHSPLFERSGDAATIDARRLDDLHYLVDAMAKQGIYTALSFYFPLWFDVQPSYGIDGFDEIDNDKPFALLFYEPRMQEIHGAWLEQLLETENPYTGRPLAEEPALAMVEIVNEDSLFFWTLAKKNVPPQHWRTLERRFGDWLRERYGSIDKAQRAWGHEHDNDAPTDGRAAVLEAWFMTSQGLDRSGVPKARVADQVRFLAWLQRGFYERTVRRIKRDLGYGGLVVCSNWQTADRRLLGPIERWTYTAGDVIDRHGYFSGEHRGEGASYSVRVGHTYEDRPAVRSPEGLPIGVVQTAGHPQIISELGWPNPNRFRAEATLLGGAYAALQGLDGLFWFAVGSNMMADASMNKFAVCDPVTAGSFPAMALLYRRGDVREGMPAAEDETPLEDLLSLEGGRAMETRGRDPSRPVSGQRAPRPAIDPLSVYIGKVVRRFDAPETKPLLPAWNRFIDRDAKRVESTTGQLAWDYGPGVVTVDAPNAQGAGGFLGAAGEIALKDVTLTCGNEFATVMVISLDDKPIARSRRVLIQAVTESRPYGFETREGRIRSLGEAPFNVRRIRGEVELRGWEEATLHVLDANGYPRGDGVKIEDGGGRLRVPLANDSLYQVILR